MLGAPQWIWALMFWRVLPLRKNSGSAKSISSRPRSRTSSSISSTSPASSMKLLGQGVEPGLDLVAVGRVGELLQVLPPQADGLLGRQPLGVGDGLLVDLLGVALQQELVLQPLVIVLGVRGPARGAGRRARGAG